MQQKQGNQHARNNDVLQHQQYQQNTQLSQSKLTEAERDKLRYISKELLDNDTAYRISNRNAFKSRQNATEQMNALSQTARDLLNEEQPQVYHQKNKLKTDYVPKFDFQEQAIKEYEARYFQGHLDEFLQNHEQEDSLYTIKTNSFILKQRPQLYTLQEVAK